MSVFKFLELLRSFSTSVHKLVLSVLRIVRVVLTVTGCSVETRKKRNNTRIRNAIYGW